MRARRGGTTRAFTLIELLVAASIFALVSSALYFTFISGIGIWKRLEDSGNTYQRMRFSLGRLSRELRQAVRFRDKDNFIASANAIEFFTVSHSRSSGKPKEAVKKVRYLFDGSKGALYRHEMPIEDVLYASEEDADKESVYYGDEAGDEVLSGISEMGISYIYYDKENDQAIWVDEWQAADDIPSDIMLTMSIKSKSGVAETFRKAIHIPTGTSEAKDETGASDAEEGFGFDE